jgi:predicted acylesterase/phospholipase RssA
VHNRRTAAIIPQRSFTRMASAACERRLVLALGSGGTRGFAHLGVIKALLEAGLHIDGICGASVGALFAMEGTVEAAVGGMATTPAEIFRLYCNRLRLAATNPLGRRLREHFGDRRIESLPVPMTILALDLESGDEVLLREGSLVAAVEASIAIPLLARPVDLNGRRLIDGGFGSAGPAIAAREMGADLVVEVNLGVRRPHLFGLERLATGATHRLRAGRERFTAAHRAALGLATLFVGEGDRPSQVADLVITPDLEDLTPHSPFTALRAFRRGEEAAHAALPALLQLVSAGG